MKPSRCCSCRRTATAFPSPASLKPQTVLGQATAVPKSSRLRPRPLPSANEGVQPASTAKASTAASTARRPLRRSPPRRRYPRRVVSSSPTRNAPARSASPRRQRLPGRCQRRLRSAVRGGAQEVPGRPAHQQYERSRQTRLPHFIALGLGPRREPRQHPPALPFRRLRKETAMIIGVLASQRP